MTARFEPHPLAELFPLLPDKEVAELADDIVTYGQRVPIVLLEGKILDGRNRYAACLFAEVEPLFEKFMGSDPLGFVLSHNLHRRHLTESQRAMVAAQIVDWDRGINQTTAGSANLQTREAAKKLSISERAVAAAKRIRDHGVVELVEAIRDGRVSVHAGEALSDLQHEEQRRVLDQEERAIIARAKDIRAARQRLRHTVRLAQMDMVAEKGRASAPVEALVYPVYYADPPWKFAVHSEVTGREKSAENHYPTMTPDEIVALMATLAGGDHPAVLFMWVTTPMLAHGFRVLEACGFKYVSSWVWDKEDISTGYWTRDQHETVLIGRRGDIAAPLPGTQPRSVYREKKTDHSVKPLFYVETIEKLYPGVARVELFCRNARPGWDVWGFESGPRSGSAAPVALSKDEKAGSVPEAPGTRQDGEVSADRGRRQGEPRSRLTGAKPALSIPPDLVPSDQRTELSIGGMRQNGSGRLGFSRGIGGYQWSYDLSLKMLVGQSGPLHDPHETFANCVAAALAFAQRTLAGWADRQDSVTTDKHRAAARGGAKWCAEKLAEFGLAPPPSPSPSPAATHLPPEGENTRPSVTEAEFDEWKALSCLHGGMTVTGPLVDDLIERGLWCGPNLGISRLGAGRLAELDVKIKAASADDGGVKVAPEGPRKRRPRKAVPA